MYIYILYIYMLYMLHPQRGPHFPHFRPARTGVVSWSDWYWASPDVAVIAAMGPL